MDPTVPFFVVGVLVGVVLGAALFWALLGEITPDSIEYSEEDARRDLELEVLRDRVRELPTRLTEDQASYLKMKEIVDEVLTSPYSGR